MLQIDIQPDLSTHDRLVFSERRPTHWLQNGICQVKKKEEKSEIAKNHFISIHYRILQKFLFNIIFMKLEMKSSESFINVYIEMMAQVRYF